LVKELFRCCEEGKEWGNVFENGCDNFPVPVKNVSAKNQVIKSVSYIWTLDYSSLFLLFRLELIYGTA